MESMVISVLTESDPGSKRKFTDFRTSWAKSAVVHKATVAHFIVKREGACFVLDCVAKHRQRISSCVFNVACLALPRDLSRSSLCNLCQKPASWAEKVASRLWMLQTSFADDPPSARHEYLVEEIERSIKDVVESRRSEYLAALMERFPGPERIDAPYFKPPEVETVERGPQEVADELIARLPEFSNEAKAVLAQKLQAARPFRFAEQRHRIAVGAFG